MYRIKLLLSILTLVTFQAKTQNIIGKYSGYDWRITSGYPNQNPRHGMSLHGEIIVGDSYGSIINTDNKEVIILGNQNRKNGKLVRMDANLKVKWTFDFTGTGVVIGKIKEKILLFTTERVRAVDNLKEGFEAILIDPANGKEIKRKKIIGAFNTNEVEWKFFFLADGTKFYILKRELNGNKYSNSVSYSKVGTLTLFEYDQNIEEKQTIRLKVTPDNIFFSTHMDESGDLTLISMSENKVKAELYSASSNFDISGTLETKVDVKKASWLSTHVSDGAQLNNEYLLSFKYTNNRKEVQNDLIKFSFKDKKVYIYSNIYNKEFRTSLSEFAVTNCELGKPKIGSLESFVTTKILNTSDGGHIQLRENLFIQGSTTPSAPRFNGQESVLDFYDKDLILLKRYYFPRAVMDYATMGIGSSVYEKNGKVYFIAPQGLTPKKYCVIGTIDLKDKSLKSCKILDKEGFDKDGKVEANALIWFDDGFVIPYSNYRLKGLVNLEYRNEFVKLSY